MIPAARILVTALVITVPTGALAQFVVQPGQDALIAQLLARGRDIGPGCRLQQVRVTPTSIQGDYRCAALQAMASIEWRHPSAAGQTAAAFTPSFVISRVGGSVAPDALIDALRVQADQLSGQWRWSRPGGGSVERLEANPPSGAHAYRAHRRGRRVVWWIPVAASACAMLLTFVVGAWRSARSAAES